MQRILDFILGKVRLPASKAVIVAALITIVVWTGSPAFQPYVRIGGNTLQLRFDCVPALVRLDGKFQTSATITRLSVRDRTKARTASPFSTFTPTVQQSGGSDSFLISIAPVATLDQIAAGMAAQSSSLESELELTAQGSTFLDVHTLTILAAPASPSAFCPPAEIKSGQILPFVTSGNVRLMRWRILQEDFAPIIYRFNATIGNVLIGVLAITVIWLFFDLSTVAIGKKIHGIGGATTSVESIEASFLEKFRTLNLWRAVGPAMGFMLTVASLVESLRPATQSTQNAYAFISGIQMAVVATFLGLLIRILCEVNISFHEKRAVESMRSLDPGRE